MTTYRIISSWGTKISTSLGVIEFKPTEFGELIHDTTNERLANHFQKFKGFCVYRLDEEQETLTEQSGTDENEDKSVNPKPSNRDEAAEHIAETAEKLFDVLKHPEQHGLGSTKRQPRGRKVSA
jgi:hypothetical protein